MINDFRASMRHEMAVSRPHSHAKLAGVTGDGPAPPPRGLPKNVLLWIDAAPGLVEEWIAQGRLTEDAWDKPLVPLGFPGDLIILVLG